MESALSCLSCTEYLKDPMTLLCGHSICRKCFTTHSDPNSQESLVFCEECKLETKNKVLREMQVMVLICDKYHLQIDVNSRVTELLMTTVR